MVQQLWKGKGPQQFAFCIKDSVILTGGPIRWQDYEGQTHEEPTCHIIAADLSEILKMHPNIGEISNALAKGSMLLNETVRRAAIKEQEEGMRESYVQDLREQKAKRLVIREDSSFLEEK